MLGDGDDVGARDFKDFDTMLDRGVQVDVVGADTGSDTNLEVLGLLDEVGGQVPGVEGSGDENFGLGKAMAIRTSLID